MASPRSTASCCATSGDEGPGARHRLVVAAGVAMFVMYLSNFDSLRQTQRAYYERQRFADVFASLKRAPLRLAARHRRASPASSAVETRVVADVTLDLPGWTSRPSGRLISIPADRRPLLNDLFLRRGRWIERGRPDEVLASEAFVAAHGLEPATASPAIINGRLRRLAIVGVALSPEYVYSIRPATWCRTTGASASSGWSAGRSPPPSTWKAGSTTSR